MNPEFFRRWAQQCRELILRARTEAMKSQLQLRAEEFEAQAEELAREQSAKEQQRETQKQ